MDHVEQEIHQVLSNHRLREPLQLNEVFEQDEDFVIHQTKNNPFQKNLFLLEFFTRYRPSDICCTSYFFEH